MLLLSGGVVSAWLADLRSCVLQIGKLLNPLLSMKAALPLYRPAQTLQKHIKRGLTVTFRFLKKQRIFWRDSRAAAGIEFAFIAPVFFTLLLGIIETGIVFYAQNRLESATQSAGREVRTGAAQGTAYAAASKCSGGTGGSGTNGAYASSQEWFKDQICCRISSLMTDCSGSLHVNVQNYTAGFGSDFSNTTDNSGNLQPVPDGYSPGTACDVVLLRTTYSWTVVAPLMSFFLVNMANDKHLLSATTAFRNEPFTSASGGC
jgi:Flp pilus assembly protein TadG